MIYQLPGGRTIEISVEQYLDMSDEELVYLNTYYSGDSIEDPWFGSVLSTKGNSFIMDDEIPEEVLKDLTEISNEEKLINPDLDMEREQE